MTSHPTPIIVLQSQASAPRPRISPEVREWDHFAVVDFAGIMSYIMSPIETTRDRIRPATEQD
jgi:hypothetical protein